MTSTDRSSTLRYAVSVFAIVFALLFPFQGHAQGPNTVKSLINVGTGSALGTLGQKADGAMLYSYPWWFTFGPDPSQQKWQFLHFPDPDYRDPLDPSSIRTRITSMHSFLYMDVAGHSQSAAYIVQTGRVWVDNSSPWRFQTWRITGPLFFIRDTGGNSRGVYTIRNGQTGMCLTEEGWGPSYGPNPVVQRPCDTANTGGRQLWSIWNWGRMVWDTQSTMSFSAWE
ncbi:MAG TPA: hypothetical protein VE422_20685 [Terriglobia bacterium]|nr:hypothetical protein [Terriglobia bacterium]